MRNLITLVFFLWARSAYAQPAPDDKPPDDPVPSEPPTAPPTTPEPTSEPRPDPETRPEPPISAEVKVAPSSLGVTYDKGIAIASADGAFMLRISFRNQIRFESVRPTEDNSQFASKFSIPRARLQAEGNAFGPTNRYKLEFAFGDVGSFGFVKDLFIEKQLPSTKLWLRAGQWKRPFNRQELVSDFASEFNERANTAGFVGGGRDLGVAIHNDYEKSPEGLEWTVGVFNGFNGGSDRPQITCTQNAMTGAIDCGTPTTTVPADFGPAGVVRVGWNVGKIKGYSEGDLEGGPPRLAVGLSYKIDVANFAKGKEMSVSDNQSHGLEADAMFKANGFGLELGLYMMKLKSADAQYGVLVQPGYFVIPKHVQLAGRFAYAPVGARKQVEGRAAFNWYWEGHAWKWATDIGFLKLTGDPSDKPDLQLRSMLQLTL